MKNRVYGGAYPCPTQERGTSRFMLQYTNMTYLHAAILGVVEGLSEFLPISSTGHLILTNHLLGLEETGFVKSFDIIIQLGAILAVAVLYFKTLATSLAVWKKIIAAFLPTAVIGLLLYKVVKTYLLGNQAVVLWALAIGGAALIIFEIIFARRDSVMDAKLGTVAEQIKAISYPQALGIGLFQSLAIVPGVSRSAATVIGGLVLGLKRRTVVEFSFLLAIVTMAAATGLDIVKSYGEFSAANLPQLGIGFVSSFLVALFAIKALLKYVKNHTFIAFGVYRLALVFFWVAFIK
jgi:undecaprenyl-diphosphatase